MRSLAYSVAVIASLAAAPAFAQSSAPLNQQGVPPGAGPLPSAAQTVSVLPSHTAAPAVQVGGVHVPLSALQVAFTAHVLSLVLTVPVALHWYRSEPSHRYVLAGQTMSWQVSAMQA